MATTSACDAWAVGYYYNGTAQRTLIEHWDGKSWKVMESPNRGGPGSDNQLYGVAATSSRDVWAVGYHQAGTIFRTLVLHWNGTAWKVQRSANPGAINSGFNAVTASSPRDAWAVGSYRNTTVSRTLVEHWNGKTWKVKPSPGPSSSQNYLVGVAATSSTNAWAVGFDLTRVYQTLILHWNGKAWKLWKSPNRGDSHNFLYGVAATFLDQRLVGRPLLERRLPHADRTLEPQSLEGHAEPEPRRPHKRQSALRRGRDLLDQRLGGGQLPDREPDPHQPDADRALERHGLEGLAVIPNRLVHPGPLRG